MYADVIVNISVDALDRVFQYRIPDELSDRVSPGTRVIIPFGKGNREISGFVIGLSGESEWPEEKMKSVLAVDEKEVPVEGQLLQLAAWIRERYGATMNEALKTVLPVRRQVRSVQEHWIHFAVSEKEAGKELDRCRLRQYKAKARLIQGMFDEGGEMTTRLAAKKYGVTRSVVDGLVKQGILAVTDVRRYRDPMAAGPGGIPTMGGGDATVGFPSMGGDSSPAGGGPHDGNRAFSLNPEQRAVVEHFSRDYREGVRKTYLLYGVTGSGKTEVYIAMIRQVLERGRQVIVLIPEIALTFQTVSRFRKRFGGRVSILNSRMSDGERFDQYERARDGAVDIMVGPRSALFVPFERLGLVIVDEEHENSYKSENPPKYHAREVARERARMAGASVVLGSATPSVESYRAAMEGRYHTYRLTARAGGARMPRVHVVDLREELRAGNRSVFSRILQAKIEERLAKGEQTMLFLNRRGYAGFVSCRSCGYVLKCSHCEISMTAHKNHVGDVDTLVCHYCGHAIAMPEVCPECGSPYIAAFGLGTQKVEDMLHRRFPKARILRMDGDTTSGRHGHEQVLEPFRRGEADILVGTQMIVKGHDFPNVTLVAALAADLGMYAGDYRGGERTFDLLMQASGRAGRGQKPGEMVVQTYNPEQYCIEAVRRQDAEYFYKNELAFRRMAKYPPYTMMLAVLVMAEDRQCARDCIQALADRIQRWRGEDVSLIGPAEAGLSRARDRYRYVLYVKAGDEAAVTAVKSDLETVSRDVKWENLCSIQYDLNPMAGY